MVDLVVHWPTPVTDEPSLRLCQTCKTAWPCQARLDEIEPAPPAARREMEAGELAIVARVGLGWHVEGVDGLRYHERQGGTVVDYHRSTQAAGDARVFRVLNWFHGKPVVVDLASADVEPAGVCEPNQATLEGHAVRLAEYVGRGHGRPDRKLEWLRMAVTCMERAV